MLPPFYLDIGAIWESLRQNKGGKEEGGEELRERKKL